jgi:NitT/TauT family transport system ATP-binding protein
VEQVSTPAASVGQLPPVQSIPTVSLSSAIGLLEVLENEGSLELFELARHVDLELVQLLLVVKAGEMLGWITTPGGRVEMTPEGRKFLAADINTRQQLLNATLRRLFVFDLVLQMLKQSPGNEVDEAAVLSQFALTFPHERPPRIMQTVVAWARYAELFRYSSTRRVFYGVQQPIVSA